MASRKGLGRGLEAILGDERKPADNTPSRDAPVLTLSLASITPDPDQPRKRFTDEALDELAASIGKRGVLQPILVRPDAETPGRFIIIAGERRWRAAGRAGVHDIPVVIRESDGSERAELALIENIQRSDLNAMEEADAYARLRDVFGQKVQEIAEAVGKSRSHVANMLRLTGLPQEVRGHVVEGQLTMGHARALLAAKDPEALALEVMKKGLSVRDTEKAAAAPSRPRKDVRSKTSGDDLSSSSTPNVISGRVKDADTRSLEADLEDALGVSVAIEHGKTGGVVTLTYDTLEQLDDICRRLVGTMI